MSLYETAVLSCVMRKPTLFTELSDLPTSAFADGLHRATFKAMLAAVASGKEPDLICTCEQVEPDRKEDRIPKISSMLDDGSLLSSFRHYVRGLKEQAYFRALQQIQEATQQELETKQMSATALEVKREESIRTARNLFWPTDGGLSGGEAWDRLRNFMVHSERAAITLGFPCVDELVGDIYPGAVVTVLARSGVGKSLFGLNVCANMLRSKQSAVMFCSLEMGDTLATHRMVGILDGWCKAEIREAAKSGQRPEQFDALTAGRFNLWAASNKGVIDIAREMDRWDRTSPATIGLVVIDYLGYLAGRPRESPYEKVSRQCREVKELAKDRNCVVLLLCQVKRGDEGGRGSSCPTLEAGRDSGAIEENADILAGLWRPTADDYTEVLFKALKVRQGAHPGTARLHVSTGDDGNYRMTEMR